jgi:hypothetical protein
MNNTTELIELEFLVRKYELFINEGLKLEPMGCKCKKFKYMFILFNYERRTIGIGTIDHLVEFLKKQLKETK